MDAVSIIANAQAAVSVNGSPADYRKGPNFQESVTGTNSTGPVWMGIAVVATNGGSSTTWPNGNALVSTNTESFTYDKDGNMLTDGRWSYTWDAENRLPVVVECKWNRGCAGFGVSNCPEAPENQHE